LRAGLSVGKVMVWGEILRTLLDRQFEPTHVPAYCVLVFASGLMFVDRLSGGCCVAVNTHLSLGTRLNRQYSYTSITLLFLHGLL